MKRSILILASAVALASAIPLRGQQPTEKPTATGHQEKVQVTLFQIDVLAMDKQGKTVTDLKASDFSMKIGTKPLEVSTVDLACPTGAAVDVVALGDKQTSPPERIAPGVKRRIVFAFDYPFLEVTMREQVLDAAASMLRMSKTDDEEVMIVALTSEVRVEQRFTKDLRALIGALDRMKHDVTLWATEVPVGATGKEYFGNIATLMDVLGSYDGAKGVVLFSQAGSIGDPTRTNSFYSDVAAHAAASRGVLYPSKPDLLTSGPGDTLTRFANQSGGRMPSMSNDLSLSYRRAQRDLSCRYTIGAYIDPVAGRTPQKFSLSTSRPDVSLRAPEMVQLFTEESKKQARAGAAYADPGPFERPLVRALAFPAVPAGVNKWDTILAVNFPAPVGATGADIDVKAVVRRDNREYDNYKRRIHVAPPADGSTSRSVTLLGDNRLESGQYSLTVLLSEPTGNEIVTAQTDFTVPQVVNDLMILRGPIMGRVVPGGLFLREKPKNQEESTLGKVLGPENGFEPLLVGAIDAKEKLIFYWSACVSGKNPAGADALVSRSIQTAEGKAVHRFDPVPLKLEERGKGISCQHMVETLPPNTLTSGAYQLKIAVTKSNGEVISAGSSPLSVN